MQSSALQFHLFVRLCSVRFVGFKKNRVVGNDLVARYLSVDVHALDLRHGITTCYSYRKYLLLLLTVVYCATRSHLNFRVARVIGINLHQVCYNEDEYHG